jgi:hypothetical protein
MVCTCSRTIRTYGMLIAYLVGEHISGRFQSVVGAALHLEV